MQRNFLSPVRKNSPLYVKLAYQFIVIFFIFYFINIAQNVLIPFAFATLLAFLLLPLVQLLEKWKIGRVISILVALLFAFIVLYALFYFLSNQIAAFVQDFPAIRQHLNEHFQSMQVWVKNHFHVSFHEQNEYLNAQGEKLISGGTAYIKRTFFSLTEFVLVVILLPIYAFLILYYRLHIRNFLFAVFKKEYGPDVQNVISKSRTMIHHYTMGLIIEMVIVATAYSIGLLIVGVKYAIFFGVLGAILNLIPYIGTLAATLITVLVTLTTTDESSKVLWIIVVFYGIHIIDSNFLMPRIVASRLRINALISILGVLIGGALTGISGLFLSVPAVAFTKIIFDQVNSLKPWGLLLGEDTSGIPKKDIYKEIEIMEEEGLKPRDEE